MITLKNRTTCFSVLTGILVLSACVDNKYDLANINTDKIEVGEDIVVPLGTGSIEANKLLDTKNVNEIKVDADGNYYVLYQDSLEVTMPSNMEIKADPLGLSVNLTDAPGNMSLPAGEYPLENLSVEENLDFIGQSKDIERIDSVLFTNSRLNLNINLKDYFTQASADLSLDIIFPEGFELQESSEYNLADNKHSLSITKPISELNNGILSRLIVKKAVPGAIVVNNLKINTHEAASFLKGRNPELSIAINFDDLNYEVVYGDFNIDFTSESNTIDMKDFKDIFEEGENVLSFADPHIKLITKSNIGIPLNCDLSLVSRNDKGETKQTNISDITIAAAQSVTATQGGIPYTVAYSKWWIGAKDTRNDYPGDGLPGGIYTYRENKDIPAILKIVPTQLDLDLTVQSQYEDVQFFTRDAFARVNYIVEIPYSPASDFKMYITEMIDKAFDEDLIEYIFSNGSVTIAGEVANSFPLEFSMNLDIVDENGKSVGIQFQPKEVKGSSDGEIEKSTVSYTIEEKDMDKMATARDIKVWLEIKSNSELAGKTVNKDQKLELNLKLQKSGGIVINKE